MSNQIYKQDLHDIALAVANGSKAYTNKEVKKAKDELITFFSKNNVDFIDHTDEPTYRFTAPTNAKLLMLQSIGGNTVKLSPSVASDSTKAMIKTMPATVYDFDVSKVYGRSTKYNQLASITSGSGTDESSSNVLAFDLSPSGVSVIGHKYLFALKLSVSNNTILHDLRVRRPFIASETPISASKQSYYFIGTATEVTSLQMQIVKNTGATSETYSYDTANVFDLTAIFGSGNEPNDVATAKASLLVLGINVDANNPYSLGEIHNIELTGLKVEGSNKWDENFEIGSIDISTGQNITSSATCRCKNYQSVLPNTTYILNYVYRAFFYDSNKNYLGYVGLTNTSGTGATFTTPYNCAYVRFNFVSEYGTTYLNNIRLNLGTTLLAYVPYVAPTTKTIDLTTIVDSNNNKLFPNGKLMGNTNVKDVLGVYNQQSKWDEVDLGSLDWIYQSGNTRFRAVLNGFKKVDDNVSTVNAICNLYDILSWNDLYSSTRGLSFIPSSDSEYYVYIKDQNYTDPTTFKTAMSGVMLQFERNTYLTSNTDLSATLRNIQGYPNGSIIAENTHNMDVESVITYNSIIQETLCPSVTVEGANLISTTDYTIGGDSYNATITFTKQLEVGVTYTISFDTAISSNVVLTNATLVSASGYASRTYITFTPTDNNVVITFAGGSTSNPLRDKLNNMSWFMLNYGSTALSYRPHKDTITRNLPTQASDGWSAGTQRNYRVFCDDEGNEVLKRETNVDKGDMGTPTWNYNSTAQQFSTSVINDLKLGNWQVAGNILCKPYTTIAGTNLSSSDMCIALNDSTKNIFAKDSKYTDGATFKLANTNEPLYYELADTSKTETDMDDFDYFFDVEEGDVITFNNAYAQQVYATYSFLIKEAKSNE